MKILISSFFLVLVISTFSQKGETEKQRLQLNLSKGNIAVEGFDVVSYFLTNPKQGNINYKTTFNGAVYYFETQTNLDLFKKSPEKFEPAYGGWCAYAMGNSGEKVEINTSTFKIVDGKLYLFYNAYFTNTLPKWNKDEKNLKTKADKNWLNYNK